MIDKYVPQDRLFLWWLGDPAQPRPVGELGQAAGGRAVSLRYAPDWLQSGFALSEDLPLTGDLFVPREKDCAAGAVDDARPDRWGERVIRKFEATPRLSILEFLLFAGDDRYGALGVSQGAGAYVPWHRSPLPKLDRLEEMAEVVRKVLANEAVSELQKRLVRPGASLGGARPKSLLEIDGEPWLVKFSEGEEINTPLIEHATMALAKSCGIDVATTRALPVGQGQALHAVAVRRFDRAGQARLHAVSAHVALRAAGEELGYPQLAQWLRRVAPAGAIRSQQEQLFRRMVFNILMDNTDDHEKNHALLRQANGHYLLSPAFDVVPSAHGLGYQAMLVGDQAAQSTLVNALSQARQFGLKTDAARAVIQQVSTGVAAWKEAFTARGVAARDIDLLAQYIDGANLRPQRDEFAARHAGDAWTA
ncbi:MAG: type II toxin-antitoxin system HipA family toxin [Burkholderiaceae bacterium]|nr:type II toxin-antitoxin system HipA family toxin [Burkholderiaceae bacterium]